jgi:hypothetical protein
MFLERIEHPSIQYMLRLRVHTGIEVSTLIYKDSVWAVSTLDIWAGIFASGLVMFFYCSQPGS